MILQFQPATSYETEKSSTPKRDPKQEAYDMLDEPVANPRYGGATMREAVIKALTPKKLGNLPSEKIK